MDWLILVAALVVILGGAELFTNGVEWVGEGFGLSEGAVGSVLAAVGTALPETVLPLIAILVGSSAGKDIGVGAILGAPFMLSTLAMCVLGGTVLLYTAMGKRERPIRADVSVPRLDLSVFLVMYTGAVVAGVWGYRPFKWVLAAALVVGYGFYVRHHFTRAGEEGLRSEATGEIKPLYLRLLSRSLPGRATPRPWVSILQTLVGLAVIVGGARVFVAAVTDLGERLHVSHLVFALLVAPVATELPETFNAGVIWARRSKDTLAVGNITGALVFQAVFPVTIGLLLTDWQLRKGSLVAGVVALAAAAVLLGTIIVRGRLSAGLLLFQGLFYAGYVAYVLTQLR
jgi:cation:H+ antiporter